MINQTIQILPSLYQNDCVEKNSTNFACIPYTKYASISIILIDCNDVNVFSYFWFISKFEINALIPIDLHFDEIENNEIPYQNNKSFLDLDLTLHLLN